MGKVIKSKIQGMSLQAKVGLVLVLTLVASVFMYEGWYKPMQVAAAISQSTAWTQQYASATYPSGTVGANYSIAAGANRLLVVAIASTATAATAQTVTNVTWNGQALTLASGDGASTATPNHTYLYYLKDASMPAATTSAPITVTITGGTSYYTYVYAATFAGVNQTGNPFTDAKNYNNGGTGDTTMGPYSPGLNIAANDQAIMIANNARTTSGSTARIISSASDASWNTATVAQTYTAVAGPCVGLDIRNRSTLTALTDTSTFTISNTAWDSMTAMSIKPFTVVNPTVTGATPALAQGASNATVTVSGTGFQSGATVSFSGTGVTAGTASYVNATTLTVPVTVAANAATGVRNVTVTNPDTGTGTGTGVFTVNAAPAPTVSSTSPTGMLPGTGPTTVTVTGTNFLSGATVAFSGTGITLGSVTYVDPTTLTVPVTVAAGATVGLRDVTVTLPGGQTGTGTGAFSVLSPCVAGQPTALAHGSETATSVPLTWTGGASTDYFRVYRDGVKISSDGAVTTGSFTDTTASPAGSYVYTVTGFNVANSCESSASASTTGETLASTPLAPTLSNVGDGTSLAVALRNDSNQAGATYAIRVNGGAYTNQFVQAGGSVGPTAAWLSSAAWGTKTVSGLTGGVTYSFDAKARNTALLETGYGPATTGNPHVSLPSTISSCGNCHGYPPVDNATRVGGTTGQFPGSHNKHAGTGAGQMGYACTKCHVNNTTYTHANGNIAMASPMGGTAGATYSRGTSFAVSNTFTPGTCNNTYCHSDGTSVSSGTIQANSSPNWGGATACNSCHGFPPQYRSGSPKMNNHTSARGHKTATCDICHSSVTYSGGVYTPDSTLHNNGAYNLKAAYGYTFATTGGTCSTPGNGCHGPTAGTWGGHLGCKDCHSKAITRTKGRPGATLAAVTTEFGLAWGHKKTGRGAVTDADCCVCHLEGTGYGTGNSPSIYHQDGNIDLRDPDALGGEVPITNISGTAFTFQRFSTSFASGSRTSTGHTSNTDIANVITQKFCLACHDNNGANNPTARTAGGTAAMPWGGISLGANYTVANGAMALNGLIDVKTQLATTNSSKHPVLGPRNLDFPTNTRLADPYKLPTTRPGTTGNKANSVVINCFDCHNVVGTPLTLRTVAAHGNAVTLRGSVFVSGSTPDTNLCYNCHTGYTVQQNHGSGSAFTSSTNSGMTYTQNQCYMCHASANAPVRPVRAMDVHGYNALASTSGVTDRWSTGTDKRPIAFIRNTANLSSHSPKTIGGVAQSTIGCTMICGSQGAKTYTIGGSY